MTPTKYASRRLVPSRSKNLSATDIRHVVRHCRPDEGYRRSPIAVWQDTCRCYFQMTIRCCSVGLALLAIAGCAHLGERLPSAPVDRQPSTDSFLFKAEPSIIAPGETALLRWNIEGATEVSIEEGTGYGELHLLGTFSGTGALSVQPKEDSTYVISCRGSTTVSCASTSIRVRLKR